MVTRKNHGLYTAFQGLLAVAFLIFLLCSFGCGEEEELPDFTPLLSEDSDTEKSSEPPFAKTIRIVLPENRSLTLYERAQSLGNAFAEKTGIAYSITDDRSNSAYRSDVYELIIGDSTHPDCALAMRGLKKDDYICSVGRYSTVIGGKTETATLLAIDRFEDEILPRISGQEMVGHGVWILEKATYERGFVSWNGTELSEYCIVYEENQSLPVRRLAELFCEEIDQISGYVINVVSEREISSRKKVIRLSINDELGQTVHIIPTEDGTELKAGTGVGLQTAIDTLKEKIFLDENGDSDCENEMTGTETLEAEIGNFRLGLVIGVPETEWTCPWDTSEISSWILETGHDGVCVFGLGERDADKLFENLWEYTPSLREEGDSLASFWLMDEADRLSREESEIEGLLGAYRIGGAHGGFRWLLVKEGTALPDWVYQSDSPLIVTVCGYADGRLAEDSGARLDLLFAETLDLREGTVCFSVYATSDCLTVEMDAQQQAAAIIDLWITRLY